MVRRCAPASGLPPRRRDPDGRIADDRLTLVRRLDAMARHLADELADGLAERCVALLGRGNAPGFNGLGPGCRREMLRSGAPHSTAASTKNGRTDTLALSPDLALRTRHHFKTILPTMPAFKIRRCWQPLRLPCPPCPVCQQPRPVGCPHRCGSTPDAALGSEAHDEHLHEGRDRRADPGSRGPAEDQDRVSQPEFPEVAHTCHISFSVLCISLHPNASLR